MQFAISYGQLCLPQCKTSLSLLSDEKLLFTVIWHKNTWKTYTHKIRSWKRAL